MYMLCSNFLKIEKSIMKGGFIRLRKLTTCKSQKSLKLSRFTRPLLPKITEGQEFPGLLSCKSCRDLHGSSSHKVSLKLKGTFHNAAAIEPSVSPLILLLV